MSQTVKNLPEMQKTQVRSLGWEDPLKKVRLKCSLVSDSLRPHRLYSCWNSLGRNTGVDKPFPSSVDLSSTGIESRSPTLQADSLPAEPQGKPKDTGVGSLSLLP